MGSTTESWCSASHEECRLTITIVGPAAEDPRKRVGCAPLLVCPLCLCVSVVKSNRGDVVPRSTAMPYRARSAALSHRMPLLGVFDMSSRIARDPCISST